MSYIAPSIWPVAMLVWIIAVTVDVMQIPSERFIGGRSRLQWALLVFGLPFVVGPLALYAHWKWFTSGRPRVVPFG